MKKLYIIRGLPGSGKSTLAKALVIAHRHKEADMYFMSDDGAYQFHSYLLKEAHEWCYQSVENLMKRSDNDVAVSNTFSRTWEYEPYFSLAVEHGFTPMVIECQNDFGNTHGVEQSVIDAMKERWER